MVSDRSLSITTIVLFGISTLVWIISMIASIMMIFTLAYSDNMVLMTILGAIMLITRYGALVVGIIAIVRTKRWQAGTPLLATTWVITGWYALLFLRDLLFLTFILFIGASVGGSGEAFGYSSLPSSPPL